MKRWLFEDEIVNVLVTWILNGAQFWNFTISSVKIVTVVICWNGGHLANILTRHSFDADITKWNDEKMKEGNEMFWVDILCLH